MSNMTDLLFTYLCDVFHDASEATLDIERLDEDFIMLGKGLVCLAQCLAEYSELAKALAKGDLSVRLPPPENELATPLKSLHASLKHLTWQSQQVAKGDYKQRVDYMGEFSDAFNTMIQQLSERQQKLEEEIELSHKKKMALEQSNMLLTNITQNIPQQIIVINKDTREILFMNASAQSVVDADMGYLKSIMDILSTHSDSHNIEIRYGGEQSEQYLSISAYLLEWNHSSAEALVIHDISAEKKQVRELEGFAFHDTMTNLHNRFSGMLTLNQWIGETKRFALLFADLDNLKYINDQYGHQEGDQYIINAANHLKAFSPDVVACRVGGDEFMLLIPDFGYNEAYIRMNSISYALQNDEHLKGKDYGYSISFGIVAVDENSRWTASDVISLADERMYEHKRKRKKARQSQHTLIKII